MRACDYDIIIIGTGPGGLGAAFHLTDKPTGRSILMIDREKVCSGGLRNDCKQNYTYPIGFAVEQWTREEAERLLPAVERHLRPEIKPRQNLEVYRRRAERLGVSLLDIRQAHVGTDRSRQLIGRLRAELEQRGVVFSLEREVTDVFDDDRGTGVVIAGADTLLARKVIVAPGRKGFGFLQQVMERLRPTIRSCATTTIQSFTSPTPCAPSAPIPAMRGSCSSATRISAWSTAMPSPRHRRRIIW